MRQVSAKRSVICWAVVQACLLAASAKLAAAPILDADFDDKTADAPIGIGSVLVGFYNVLPVGPLWLDDLLVEDFGGLLCAWFEGGTTGEWSFTEN